MRAETIDETRVRQAVEQHGCDWIYRDDTGSTNADVLDYHANHGREVVAFSESQQAGRGRRGRQWISPFASNIYCTIGIVRKIPANSQGLLSMVTGLALCRALRQSVDLSVNLKWPNDILFDGHKLGGILIESKPVDGKDFFFAIGFGLNIFMTTDELAEIPQPVTSLGQIVTSGVDRSQLTVASIDSVIRSVRAFELNAVSDLIAEFAQHDAFHDRRIEVITGQGRSSGINRGITPEGQLQLETEQGMEIHAAAEISMRAATE